MPRRQAAHVEYAGLDLAAGESVQVDVPAGTTVSGDMLREAFRPVIEGELRRERDMSQALAYAVASTHRNRTPLAPDPLTVADYARLYPQPVAAQQFEVVEQEDFIHVNAQQMATASMLREVESVADFTDHMWKIVKREFGLALVSALSASGPCLVGRITQVQEEGPSPATIDDVVTFRMHTRLLRLPAAPASGADVPVTIPADF